MDERKDLIITGFFVGIGFWTASKIVLVAYRFIMEFIEF